MTRVLILSAAVFAAAGPLAAQPKAAPKRVAVLVGVNEYQDARLGKLRYAEADAADMKSALPGYEVTLLTGKAATKAAVERAIQTATARRDLAGGTLLLGLAGHGVQFEGGADSYFCPVDGKPAKDQAASLVSIKWVYDRLEKDAAAAGVRLLLVDACRDDPGQARAAGVAAPPRGLDAGAAPPPPKGVGVLLSCSAGERAFEHQDYKHGVFFHHVIQGLKGKAEDSDGDVTWDSLRGYVKKQVATEVPGLIGGGAKQQPNETGNLSGAPPVLLPGARYVSLFNGKDLSGWEVSRYGNKPPGVPWKVVQGMLWANGVEGKQQTYLITARDYSDYRLKFEYALEKGGNTGLALRAIPNVYPAQIEIADDADPKWANTPTGKANGAGGYTPALPPTARAKLKPAGEWNAVEVELKGSRFKMWVNGGLVQDADLKELVRQGSTLEDLRRSSGRIGFQQHTGIVRLRNIEVKELK